MASPRQQQYGSFLGPRVEVIELKNVLPQIANLLPKAAMSLARKYLDKVYDYSQIDVPVDTGLLKSSGAVIEESSKSIVLRYDAKNNIGIPYPAYVEYGTYKTRAQPYVNPAVEKAMSVFQDGIEDALSGL